MGAFVLGMAVAVLVNLFTAAFGRKHAFALMPWLTLYVAIHGLCVFISTDAVWRESMAIARNHGSKFSYVLVIALFAAFGATFWYLLQKGVHILEQKTSVTEVTKDSPSDHPSVNNKAPVVAAEKPAIPHEEPHSPPLIQPTIQVPFVPPPVFGNLAERTTALAQEIVNEMMLYEWVNQSSSNTPAERMAQTQRVSDGFRRKFLHRVADIRDEFSQFHLRDQRLDDYLAMQTFPLMLVQQVVQRLGILTKQIPVERRAPKEVPFLVSSVIPKPNQLQNQISIAVDPAETIASGYLVVELATPFGLSAVDTDLVGSQIITPFDQDEIVGNRPLNEYLSLHSTECYVLKVGENSIKHGHPVHVHISSDKEIQVKKVLHFEK